MLYQAITSCHSVKMILKSILVFLVLVSSTLAGLYKGNRKEYLYRRGDRADCIENSALNIDEWIDKPSNATASICYNGSFHLDDVTPTGYKQVVIVTCEEDHVIYNRNTE